MVKIDHERRKHLQQHASLAVHEAPIAVSIAVASVIGESEIQATWPQYVTSDGTTVWTCWVLTERSLGYVHVEYELRDYDRRNETQNGVVTPSKQSAWARPLADITKLELCAFYQSAQEDDEYQPAEPTTLVFRDEKIVIPAGEFPPEDRRRADRFISALRKGVGF